MRFLKVFGALVLGAFSLAGASAWAAPSLIVLEDRGEGGSPQQKVLESFASVVVSKQLGAAYDHIDILVGERASADALFEAIRRRTRKSAVDVLLLTHGRPGAVSLESGDLTLARLAAEGRFPGLRMVYMMACYGASMVQAWRDAGAELVIGHQEVNSLPGFFFPKFIHAWSQGWPAAEAVRLAHRSAEGTARRLAGYILESELLDASGVAHSEPVLAGVDLDRYGRRFPDHELRIPIERRDLTASGRFVGATYPHTDFERFSLQALGGMIPGATLRTDAIPSAQKLTDEMADAVWGGIEDSFGDGQGEIWIDGGAARELLGGLGGDFGGAELKRVMERLQGVRLARLGAGFRGAIYFDAPFEIAIQDEARATRLQLYAVHVPKTVRLHVEQAKGVLTLTGLDQGADALELKLKLPVIPDGVFLRSASVNLSSGKVLVEAGLVHNALSLVATADLQTRALEGIGFWESVRSNRDLLFWPDLFFRLR